MARFKITCRAVLSEGVVEELEAAGVYRFRGGRTDAGATSRSHHLQIEADSGQEALEQVRQLIEAAGGDASNLRLVD
jgi:hypothetical protein